MSGVSERTVGINGHDCRIWEKGAGEPLFYLAGFGGLPRWTPFLERLSAHRHVIAPSLPGFPGSAGHVELDTLLDWIAATLDLLDAAGLKSGDLVGASVGGALAAEIAAMSPASVRRLALIAPLGLYDPAAKPADLWAQTPVTQPALLCADPETYKAHIAPPEGADAGEWGILMTRANEAAARLLWPLCDTRLVRRLHRIRAETLLVWGEADRVLAPSYAQRFADGISGKSRIEIIPGAGHLADLDAPGAVAEEVLAALA
ncbi:MAG: alpha/beta hydrolase fold [Rhodospirillales bacterium]|nr:alpha/beta hydrolase fold [Rhodospirillales bacterium]